MPTIMVQGQSVKLERLDFDFSKVTIGLGWDIRDEKKGVFAPFAAKKIDYGYDLDAFALLLDIKGKIVSLQEDVIYYRNLRSKGGAIEHLGDNLTGEGEGDDEQIQILLSAVPDRYSQIIIGVNIYKGEERKQDFMGVKNAFVRACDANGQEICRYDLAKNIYHGHATMLLGNLYRRDNRWKFLALGEAKLGNLQTLVGGLLNPDTQSGTELSLDK